MCCRHCDEPLLPHERSHDGFHIECLSRMILGSVGHQMGRCSCYGGTEEDPPGMTTRQAAIAAYDLGYVTHRQRRTAILN